MKSFLRLWRRLLGIRSGGQRDLILSPEDQLKAWRRASRRMGWAIREEEFLQIDRMPPLSDDDRNDGYVGSVLFYGFGNDGSGNADSVLSGKAAWEYALKSRGRGRIWQCEYVHFNEADCRDYVRLWPSAPTRPGGFYWAKFQPGERMQSLTVSQARKGFKAGTGCGPEGIQVLAITHPHFAELMNQRKMPFMALADYDVAPYGYDDFFDAPQMFCSNGVLGMGIGNVDRHYPLFGIPSLRFNAT